MVEVLLTYPEDAKTLQGKRMQLEDAAADLAEPYRVGLGNGRWPRRCLAPSGIVPRRRPALAPPPTTPW